MQSNRRRRPDCKAWQPVPGKPLPDPVIIDDRDLYPQAVVNNVLSFLDRERPRFHHLEPTPIMINMSRSTPALEAAERSRRFFGHGFFHVPPADKAIVDYAPGEKVIAREDGVDWKPCTVEMHLQNRTHGLIQASYRYLAAKNAVGHCIVGPLLGIVRRG